VLPFTAADLDDMGDDFGAFDADFGDPFADNQVGPFSSSPFTVASQEEAPLAVSQKRSQLEDAADSMFSDVKTSSSARKKRRTTEVESVRSEPEQSAPGGVAELFRMIPKEIKPTRMPGTDVQTPFLYRVIVLGLVLVNVGAAVLTFNKILAPIG
jgi:hypothetical protein